MILRPFIILLAILWWNGQAMAQVPEEASSSMPEQWQLTLDVIKSKAQTLMVQNNGLQDEYRQLMGEAQRLQQAINDQQIRNDRMSQLIKDRHGRSDQQLHIEELTKDLRTKTQQAQQLDDQLGDWQRKKTALDQKLQQLKYTISGLELQQAAEKSKAQLAVQTPVPPQPEDQLAQWRKDLVDENRQELLLQNELEALKTGDKVQNVDLKAVDEQNKQLEARLDVLRLQKLQHISRASFKPASTANARRYAQLKKRKEQLEVAINAYESRIDDLKESSLMSLSWPVKRKQLVHQMVQVDARNNQLVAKIKVLREDIDILREQVARLERRLDFAKDKTPSNTAHWVDLNYN